VLPVVGQHRDGTYGGADAVYMLLLALALANVALADALWQAC
jgi:hypothetical protein